MRALTHLLLMALLAGCSAGEEQVIAVPCTDIVAGCTLAQAGLQVRFDRTPGAMQAFKLFVALPQAREVHARFSMQGMEMGLNRYRLLADGPGHWQAEVMLPACVQGRRDWLLTLEADGARYQLPFRSE